MAPKVTPSPASGKISAYQGRGIGAGIRVEEAERPPGREARQTPSPLAAPITRKMDGSSSTPAASSAHTTRQPPGATAITTNSPAPSPHHWLNARPATPASVLLALAARFQPDDGHEKLMSVDIRPACNCPLSAPAIRGPGPRQIRPGAPGTGPAGAAPPDDAAGWLPPPSEVSAAALPRPGPPNSPVASYGPACRSGQDRLAGQAAS
jgi:hypothetical protein